MAITTPDGRIAVEAERAAASESFWRRSARRFVRNRFAVAALVTLVLFHVGVFALPHVLDVDPNAVDIFHRFAAPSTDHWLGTDEMGRDVFSRLLHGGQISLLIGLSSMLGALVVGVLLGTAAGFFEGWVDALIMRVTDAMLSLPVFFLLLTVLAFFGNSLENLVLVIALTSWMPVCRIVRAETLQTRSLLFVEAARAVGARAMRILFIHVLPHSVPSLTVAATLGVARAILTESALSYLGLGVSPPTASWGNMLSSARSYIWSQPELVLYPGVLIFITVLVYNALGDGLRDALDPSSDHKV